MKKENIMLRNMAYTVMGFAIGTTATEYAVTCAEYADYTSILLVPIALIATCLITAILSSKEQAKSEFSKPGSQPPTT